MKKTPINSMKLETEALSANESFARQTICAFAAQLDPTLEEIADLRVVISEAVTNCVVHAYRGSGGKIEIYTKLYADGTVKIKIRDRGCGIEDIEKCMQPMYTTDPEGERGGMGFPIMKSLSEKFRVISRKGVGTVLNIEMKFARGT